MNAREAYSRLRVARVPVIETAEAAALFGQSRYAASKTLARLADSELVTRIRSGVWWVDGSPNRSRAAEYLVAPYPAYLSLYTALRMHGMIEQIPAVTYAVTLGRSQRVRTSIGAYAFHQIRPELFTGFAEIDHVKVASPEKALFDLAYLAGGRSRLRAGASELELPKRFRPRELQRWIALIPSQRTRTLVAARLDQLLAAAKHP